MNGFLNDLRFGLRQLIAKPGFAAAAILTLALGIGANTAVFSVLNGYLLKPLPYPDGSQLVTVNESYPGAKQPYAGVSVANYVDVTRDVTTFSGTALYDRHDFNLTLNGRTQRVAGLATRSSLFNVLRAKPYLGQTLAPANDEQGHDQVAVLSYSLWQSAFGGSRGVAGQAIKLDGKPYRVIGVMPEGFRFPDNRVQVWVPFVFPAGYVNGACRDCEGTQQMIARLAPGATLAGARAQLAQTRGRVMSKSSAALQAFLKKYDWGFRARSYRDVLLGQRAPLLLILQGFVLLLLLMTCVNVANLLLARTLGRMHEIAMRAALGASRWVLVRQMLAEALCVAVPGGLIGVAFGWLGLGLVEGAGFQARLGVFTLAPDWHVALFVIAAVALVTIFISVLPVRQLARNDLQALLQAGSRSVGGGRRASRLRGALVVGEIALAAALLGGAGLLVNSSLQLQAVDPGFRSDHVLAADILPPQNEPGTSDKSQFYTQLLAKAKAIPGVRDAGLVSNLPIDNPPLGNAFDVPGVVPRGSNPIGNVFAVTGGFFKVLGINLLRGRLFGPQDTPQGQPVIIIDKFLADRWFHGENPIGRQMIVGGSYKDNKLVRFTIIGEVASIRAAAIDQPPQRGSYYINSIQFPNGLTTGSTLILKTAAAPYVLNAPIRQMVNELNPLASVSHIISMHDVLAQSLAEREAVMLLVLVFGCIGLALAAVGVYGVLSYVVGQRTTECGVRLALGALPGDLLWLIIRDGLRMLAIGLCIGLLLAVVLGYSMSSQLFNVAPFDPLTLAGVIVALSIITLAACWLPARRAAKLDPAVAIQES